MREQLNTLSMFQPRRYSSHQAQARPVMVEFPGGRLSHVLARIVGILYNYLRNFDPHEEPKKDSSG